MMDPNDARLLKEITPHLVLERIHVVRGEFRRREEPLQPDRIKLTVHFEGEVVSAGEENLDCRVLFALTGREGRRVVIKIESLFRVAYRLRGKTIEAFTDEHLQAAARLNAPYNAWPYWREFVTTATHRMGVPPITLPLFRLVI